MQNMQNTQKTKDVQNMQDMHDTQKIIKVIAKDCLLTGKEQACSRITRLVVIVRHHAENG